MRTVVFVSRLREMLDECNLDVGELHRRLTERGYDVSRRALDRLVSDRPIREVSLGVLLPIIEELEIDLPSAFQAVETPERLDDHATGANLTDVRPEATQQRTRRAAAKAADAELLEVSARLEAELRRQAPELFDSNGRLRTRKLGKWTREQTGGAAYLSIVCTAGTSGHDRFRRDELVSMAVELRQELRGDGRGECLALR